ncbi:hypothetical protein PT2222_110356 [Paraburkholderia tropica]
MLKTAGLWGILDGMLLALSLHHEIVVFREPQHEIKRVGRDVAQPRVEHHAFQVADNHRAHVGRVTQVRVFLSHAARGRTETRHCTGEAFRPVARPESLAFVGHALDDVSGRLRAIHLQFPLQFAHGVRTSR